MIYIDDDLKIITQYAWIFANLPEIKKLTYEAIRGTELEEYLLNLEQRYPAKYVKTGHVTFITVENKEKLASEFTENDQVILQKISDAIDQNYDNSIESKWGSSNPNVHADMARWAGERNGVSGANLNAIANNADAPDLSTWNYGTPGVGRYYDHYYGPVKVGPVTLMLGAAHTKTNQFIQEARKGNNTYVNIGYATHYMCDISNPLHANKATDQVLTVLSDQHTKYETYMSGNWTNGQNYSRFAQNVGWQKTITNPTNDVTILSAYSGSYADTVYNCMKNNQFNNSSLFYATIFCVDEGQGYLIGLVQYGLN